MNKLKFTEMPISEDMQKAISDMGFQEASPIQAQAILPLLEGKDVTGQAQTGTGKTSAFAIPVIERINEESNDLQAIILCPTRELAVQINEEFRKLTKYKRKIKTVALYGGQPIDTQIKLLRRGTQIVIATPGRLLDHVKRNTVRLSDVKMIVLDEADEMLDMGFRPHIESVLHSESRSGNRQVIFFSATMSPQIMDLTKRYQSEPEFIRVATQELSAPNIEQFYFQISESMKSRLLTNLIDKHKLKLALVFCNTKRQVDELVDMLTSRGYYAGGLHGDMRQSQRDKIMNQFRKGSIEILVATDVASRGINVNDVEAVFNYDIPEAEESYVHRIGRTGRRGKSGQAFTFVVGSQMHKIRSIQKFTKVKINSQQPEFLLENNTSENQQQQVMAPNRAVLLKKPRTRVFR